MAKIEFTAAAKRHEEAQGESPEVFEFSVGGEEFVADMISPGQATYIGTTFSTQSTTAVLGAVLELFDLLLHGDGGRRLRRLVLADVVKPELLLWGDELNSNGILGSMLELAAAGRPTPPSSGSSGSQGTGGRRSTGRSPGKGSTSSTSGSTDS